MASISQGTVTRRAPSFAGRNGLVDRYFYFAMSLLIAVIVVCGFSLTIDQSLFHAAHPATAVAVDSRRRILGLGGVLHPAIGAGTDAST